MSSNPTDPFSQNVIGVTDLVTNDLNKIKNGTYESPEGVVGEKADSYSLNMSDADLLKLRDKWEKDYASYEAKMKAIFERNLESYLGKRKNGEWLANVDGVPLAANLQFEAEETFLSAALSKNPQPVVFSDNTAEGNAIANTVKTMLQFHADTLILRRKLSLMVRQWSIYHLGVLKLGYDRRVSDVSISNRKIQDFIFDCHGHVDAYGDFIGYLGERITISADKLIELYPKAKTDILLETEGNLGTDVVYTEWWTDEFCFVTYKKIVLDKFKNPYYRYESEEVDEEGEVMVDDFGEPVMKKPRNHFAFPKKPFVFLSVFSLQEQPHDITGLIEQNIPNQNLISKRVEQIDYNISASNNGYAYSEDNFNQETAKQASTARSKGNPILVPSGGPADRAIIPLQAIGLPSDAFNELENNKNNLRTSWGVQGITAEPQDEDQTARGMILNQSHDTTRIGGGIGSAVEQVADNVFNWLTQLYYVFYDEKHFGTIVGNAKAVEFVTLSNQDLDRQLVVSVAPDSLRPRDEVTEMNLAQALFDKGAIGPKTLLKMLSFPNPEESAADGVMYKIDPMAYMQLNFPEYAQKLQESMQMQAQQQMMNQAQGAAMEAQAQQQIAPEEITEPQQGITREPASASLGNVPLPEGVM